MKTYAFFSLLCISIYCHAQTSQPYQQAQESIIPATTTDVQQDTEKPSDWKAMGYFGLGSETFYVLPTGSLNLGSRITYKNHLGIDAQARFSSIYFAYQLKGELSALWHVTSNRSRNLYLGTGYGYGIINLHRVFTNIELTTDLHGPKVQIGWQKNDTDGKPTSFWDLSVNWNRFPVLEKILNTQEEDPYVPTEDENISRPFYLACVLVSYGMFF